MDTSFRPPTLKDVAQVAKVSVMTVSLVFNGKGRISKQTQQKVREAAASIGYQPGYHQAAIQMSMRRSGKKMPFKTIGLVWANQLNSLNDISFFREIFEGMINEAWKQGVSVMLLNLQHDDQFILTRLGQIDGLVCPIIRGELLEVALSVNHPLVTMMSPYPGFSDVGVDDFQIGKMATEYLYSLGHRKIAFLGPSLASTVMMNRLAGFRQALEQKGVALPDQWVRCRLEDDYDIKGEYLFEEILALPERPTGIVCYNDVMAIGALKKAHEKGIKIPEDFSIIGIDGIPEGRQSHPALTSVDIGLRQIGAAALNHVRDMIDNVYDPTPLVLLPLGIIPGGSSAENRR